MNPLLTTQFWDSSRSKKKTKGEKTPPYIFVDGKPESDVLSLVSKTTGDSSVNKYGALLEEFDPFPFFSVLKLLKTESLYLASSIVAGPIYLISAFICGFISNKLRSLTMKRGKGSNSLSGTPDLLTIQLPVALLTSDNISDSDFPSTKT